MKTIKYTILFLTFLIGLYYSQSVTILATTIWNFLYGQHELFSFFFIFITVIYLVFIYSYFNLLNINRKLVKFLLKKLSFFNLFLLFLNIIYDVYYYLFQFVQPLLISYISNISKSKILFINLKEYYRLNLEYFVFILSSTIRFFKYGFSNLIYGSDLLKNTFLSKHSERQFVASLIKKAYTYPIYIQSNGRNYKLSLEETLGLLYKMNFKYKINNSKNISKLLKNLIKLINFVDKNSYLYETLYRFEDEKNQYPDRYMFHSKKQINKLLVDDVKYYTRNHKKLLRIIKNNPKTYRLFVLMCFHKYLSKIKSFLNTNKLVISIDFKLPDEYNWDFYKLEYNLFYLYQKEVNLNEMYFKFFISKFFKEMKIMFQFIKYFIFIYFLMLIINPIFMTYFLIIILFYSLILQYLKIKTFQQYQLLKYKIYRLIYYKICYSLNLLILTNSLYLILINYLVLTLILILIFSLIISIKAWFGQVSDSPVFFSLVLFKEIYYPFYRLYWRNIYHINKFKYNIITFFFKDPMDYHLLIRKIFKFLNKN